MSYKHLFGPVPSRRLGMSLGVDLVPRKVCSLDCVYCEVGETTRLTLERKEYVLFDRVTAELEEFFKHHPDPDFITFSGAGEPTLNSRIGEIIVFIKKLRPGIPVAVLTNGTLLSRRDVRMELEAADVVLPSLDAATQEGFERINRPDSAIRIDEYIQGLVDFRQEFRGRIWLEVLILPGYNDDETELEALRQAIMRIGPDAVQLNTLDRPGTVHPLVRATRQQLQAIAAAWQPLAVEIIASAPQRKHIQSYRGDTEAAILETISRRPCTPDDLMQILGLHVNELNKYLDVLEAEGKVETVRLERGLFYQSKK